ncbi:50S ribosomal protein L6 [Candidatus Endobugula sertula]|uniref:Large ribosomal subunit protein uL6 n=1 Tax=Candidatus Endobugula sertula TaxID=62101 RepID=A0A1D2QTK0_9GAMM|nr:50S ribosomal protein L6 [Candidatus Endobugula sertula]
MSRIANSPVELPAGVEVKLESQVISVKGGKGSMSLAINQNVDVKQEDNVLTFSAKNGVKSSVALAGTTRALVNNMVVGVSVGFEKKLILNGVGYRTKVSGKILNLVLGFSHDVNYELPDGVTAETPTQTEIVLKSVDKQLLGQVAAEIRAFRPPEPYKGKGVRYGDEYVRRKEAKKK